MTIALLLATLAHAENCRFVAETTVYEGQGAGDNGPFELRWSDAHTQGHWDEEVPTDGPEYRARVTSGAVTLGGAVELQFFQPSWFLDTFVFTGTLSADGVTLEGIMDGYPFTASGETTCLDLDGLVGRWKLGENKQIVPGWPPGSPDAIRGESPLVDPLDPTRILDGACGDAYHFGGGSRLQVADDAALAPEHVTVEAWVRADGSPGQNRYVVAKGADACIASSYALYSGFDGGLSFYVYDGAWYYESPDAGSALWDGEWHFAAGTYDGEWVRLYVDGVEVGTGTFAGAPIAYGLPDGDALWIGAYAACSLPWEGDIDEVRVWETALDASAIAADATSCVP